MQIVRKERKTQASEITYLNVTETRPEGDRNNNKKQKKKKRWRAKEVRRV